MNDVIYAIGQAGASEEYARAAAVGSPHGAANLPFAYARAMRDEYGAITRPRAGALAALWAGDLHSAYDQADTDLAIVLEAAFSDSELGLAVSPANNPHNYTLA